MAAFIIAPLGSERSPERRRINYLESQIAEALAEKGFHAALITSDGGKERITEFMIRRLTEDRLAVAVMDDFNRNVMYEVAIRHALCLPTIHLIESTFKERPPFDMNDVELIRYPRIEQRNGKFSWPKKVAAEFRAKLKQRADQQLKGSTSAMFTKGLRKASATAILHTILEQKRQELAHLGRGLRLAIEFIEHDFRPNARMEGDRVPHHSDLLNSNYTRLQIANDTLFALVERAGLADVQSDRCSQLCERISSVTEQLASVFQKLMTMPGTELATSKATPRPTRKTTVASLQNIIVLSQKLAREISSLHNPINL